MKHFYLYVIATLVTLFSLPFQSADAQTENIEFTDANLAAAVRSALGLATGADIPKDRLETLTRLSVVGNENTADTDKISDLTGLQYATNLEVLTLTYQALTSLDPLEQTHLPALTYLDLSHNQLTDAIWEVMNSRATLEEVRLSNNQLTRFEMRGWSAIKRVDASHNSITYIRWTRSSLLDSLDLSHNALTGVRQTHPETGQNDDFNVITNAVKDIDLSDNEITIFRTLVIGGKSHPERMDLSNNQLQSLSGLRLRTLQFLYLYNNPVTNLSPLQRLRQLKCIGFTWFEGAAETPFTRWFPKNDSSFEDGTPQVGDDVTICPPEPEPTLPPTQNNIPVFGEGRSATRTIAEDTLAGQNIGSPVAATDANTFAIVSRSGQLLTKAPLDPD